ncbi:SH3 domain-containing protein, partial [bacterium]
MVFRSRCFLALLALGFLLLTPGGFEKQQAAEYKSTAASTEQSQPYITTSDVKVRSGPGTQYKVIAEIKNGTKVNVADSEGEWLKIVSKRG